MPALIDRLIGRYSLAQDVDDARVIAGADPRSAESCRIELPLVLGTMRPGESVTEYARRCPSSLGLELVVLARAGAFALGLWENDMLLRHKVDKRYVVRGNGRAQPTYLESKGKSRFGSRLRLQNARALLRDTHARIASWQRECGRFERVFHAAPVRLWADFLAAAPGVPFESDAPRVRIPVDFGAPGYSELLRVRRLLTHARVTIEHPEDRGTPATPGPDARAPEPDTPWLWPDEE